jgi:hypothetical protein
MRERRSDEPVYENALDVSKSTSSFTDYKSSFTDYKPTDEK